MKQCKECLREYPLENFRSVGYLTKSGEKRVAIERTCKQCRNVKLKEWKAKNRTKVNDQERRRYQENRDSILERNREKFKEIYADPVAHALLKEKRRMYRSLHPDYVKSKVTPRYCFMKYQKSAEDRRLAFGLTIDMFSDNWGGLCWYCGDQLKTIGWDRIDNSIGYLPENVRLCCKECNFMKSSMSEGSFLKRIFSINARHGN